MRMAGGWRLATGGWRRRRAAGGFERGARTPQQGFTLVELIVALLLASIIALSIMIISNEARAVYEVTRRKVELYNKFRATLLTLEKDFSQWIPTANMEFFADGKGANSRPNENWEEGEQLPDEKDEKGPGVVDGGVRDFFDEFATITERHYEGQEEDGTWKIHDAYQAYFRTMTFIDGRLREANVEYMLLDPSRTDPATGNPLPPERVERDKMKDLTLFKIVRYHNFSPEEIHKRSANFPIKRTYVEVCTNITDFRLEYTTDNRFDTKVNAALRTPREDNASPAETVTRPEKAEGRDGLRKIFGYGTYYADKFSARQLPLAYGYRAFQGDRQGSRTDHRPVRFGFRQNPNIKFAELTPGDKIYLFTESGRGGQAAGGNLAGANLQDILRFPPGVYTVKTNLSGEIELFEDIDSVGWGGRDASSVRYKAAFLPDAVRVTLRVVDEEKGNEPRTLQRVIWVRRKAR